MPLETATTINQLDPNNPTGSDPVAFADDHLRLIKGTLKNTFPNVAGVVSPSHTDMNTRLIPSGLIAMWSGAANAIPVNWVLCDGNNGTPNLKDRFIVGAGGSYAVGASGGAVTATSSSSGSHSHTMQYEGSHSHGGATGGHALTIAEMPSHSHTWTRGTGADGGDSGIGRNIAASYQDNTSTVGGNAAHSHPISADGNHVHTIDVTTAHTHTIDTRSPYYALCFIMKV